MMCFCLSRTCVTACSVIFLLSICGQAVAFNPQPEPPGDRWRIEGFADLLSTAMAVTDTDPPFGLNRAIVGDDVVDFSAGMIARFEAPDNNGDNLVDDGIYAGDLLYFRVKIGDTDWDEMIPNSGMLLKVERGVIVGLSFTICDTLADHPDLTFMFPASPGTWEALDKRDGINLGTISGIYELRDGIVPEPTTFGLLGGLLVLGALLLIRRHGRV